MVILYENPLAGIDIRTDIYSPVNVANIDAFNENMKSDHDKGNNLTCSDSIPVIDNRKILIQLRSPQNWTYKQNSE